MQEPWEADPYSAFTRRLGRSPADLGVTTAGPSCPEIWELTNGDFAVIGRDLTSHLRDRLPGTVRLREDEKLVVIPRRTLLDAKGDIPDV
jgi:hypothetical protein